jgi:glycosyltransferase involved in cell wall biosynthesis
MELPLVTIVTPSYNQGQFLEETIRSVLAQDYPRIEYAVVDGGSSDGSLEIIERHADRLAWHTSGPDGGQAAALNRAYAQAKGDILGWINSDDTLLPGAITRAVEALTADPGLLLVYADAVYIDEQSNVTGVFPAGELDVVEMLRGCADTVVQPGSLFRRRALELAGPFEGYFAFDFDFVLRIGLHGRSRRLDAPLATYRLHPESKSMSRPELAGADILRMYDRFFSQPDLPPAVLAVEAEARAQSGMIAGELLYAGLRRREARRAYLGAIARQRSRLDARAVSLVAKTFLPNGLVRRLRALRARQAGA